MDTSLRVHPGFHLCISALLCNLLWLTHRDRPAAGFDTDRTKRTDSSYALSLCAIPHQPITVLQSFPTISDYVLRTNSVKLDGYRKFLVIYNLYQLIGLQPWVDLDLSVLIEVISTIDHSS